MINFRVLMIVQNLFIQKIQMILHLIFKKNLMCLLQEMKYLMSHWN